MNDEHELINDIINGNNEGFDILIRKYTAMVYNTVYSITGRNNEIDDIVQDVFINAFTKISGFKHKASFKTWLYRITVNKCLDTARKKKYHRTVPLEDVSLQENNNTGTGFDRTQEILNLLAPGDRTIVALRDIDGFSYLEISRILKCSIANVKVRLFRARKELARRYKKHEN